MYDSRAGEGQPLSSLQHHRAGVTCLGYSSRHNIALSCDEAGMVEYWSALDTEFKFPKNVAFESKVLLDIS